AGQREDAALDGLRVLVVDDEPDNKDVVGTLLSSRGAEVRLAGSSRQAVEMLREWKPDVLVTDIAMPDQDGYDLLASIRNQEGEPAEILAVALTAYASREDRIRLLSAGFQAHVTKPVDSTEVTAVVGSLGGAHHGRRSGGAGGGAPTCTLFRRAPDARDRYRLRRSERVLAAPPGRGGGHAQPDGGRRERLFARRAGGAGRDRARQRADRRVRVVQRRRHAGGRARRARQRRAGDGRPAGGRRPARGGAWRLPLLRRRGRRGGGDLPAALPVRGASGARGAGAARPLAPRRAPAGDALQPRRLRRRLRGAVAARALALPPLPVLGRECGGDLLRRGDGGRALAVPLREARRAHRARADDGLHAPPGQPLPGGGRRGAERAARGHVHAAPSLDVVRVRIGASGFCRGC